MRSFIGIPLSVAVIRELQQAVKHMPSVAEYGRLRWIAPENYHVTLHFLGKITAIQFQSLREKLTQELKEQPCFQLFVVVST